MLQYILPYLAHNNELSLKGIGTFVKDCKTPLWQMAEQQLLAPNTQITFLPKSQMTTTEFLQFVAQHTQVDANAIENEMEKLLQQNVIEIKGIGILHNEENEFLFTQTITPILQPIPALKVKHQNEVHAITVGDHQMSNVTMQEYYDDTIVKPKKPFNWLIAAWILFALTCLYIAYYFFRHK
jgi:hypothetical protein